MDDQKSPPIEATKHLIVENWPMSLEAIREQLKKAKKRLEQYRVALRLGNAEIERRNRGIIALTSFAYQISRVSNPAALIKLALAQALEGAGTQVGAIILIDVETTSLRLGVHKGVNPILARILTGRQLGHGATTLMPHLVAGSGALLEYRTSEDEMERRLLEVSGLTSLVSLPLQLGPRLMGTLLVGLKGNRVFTPAEIYFLMAISQETVMALEGLHLREGIWQTAANLLDGEVNEIELQSIDDADVNLQVPTPFDLPTSGEAESNEDDLEYLLAAMMEAEDEVEQQNLDLQTLNGISEMMNGTLKLTEILQCAIEQTQAVLKTEAVWIYLVDEHNHLNMKTQVGLSDAYVRGMKRLKMGEQIEGQALAQKQAYFIESVDTYRHKIWVDQEKLRAIAAVPITRPEQTQKGQSSIQVVGVLAIGKKGVSSYVWSPREMRLLNSIANQVALAIDNARLYAQVQENEAGLRAGNEVLQTINDMLLKKNVFLEGFIQEDLGPTLKDAVPVLQHLLTTKSTMLTETQKQDIAGVQNVISHLSNLVQVVSDVNEAFDTGFEQALKDKQQDNSYAKLSQSKEIEQNQTNAVEAIKSVENSNNVSNIVETETYSVIESNSTPPTNSDDTDSTSVASGPNRNIDSKAMSFKDAVAAGLVPAHILNKEMD